VAARSPRIIAACVLSAAAILLVALRLEVGKSAAEQRLA
jgi:hypothetical protein